MIDFCKMMNAPETGEGGGNTDTEPDTPTTNNCPVCNKPIDECTCGCCKPTPPDCNCGCTPNPPCKPCPELPRRGTPFYHLPQWGPADLCDWFVKMNISMMTIDSALHNMDLKIMRQPGELECRIKQLRADLQDLSDIVTCQSSSLIELKDRMDAVETNTNALQETINNQQLQISNLDTRVTTSELNVAAMQTRVANLDAAFSKVTSEFALLKQDFANLNLKVKAIEDAQTLIVTRVTEVEDGLEAEVQRSTTKDGELQTEIDALKQVDDDLISKDRELEAKNLEQDGKIQNNSSRIDTLANGLKSAQDNIVIVKSNIVDLQREDTAIKARLDSAETDITNLQDKDGVLEANIAQNTTNITTLTSTVENLVTTEEGHDTRLTNLETRTTANETELESQDSRITALEESDMAQGEKITTLEQNDDTMANTIATINDTVGSHTTKIGQLTTKQTQMEEDLELASENATNAKNGVDALTPKVEELDTRVSALEEGGGSEESGVPSIINPFAGFTFSGTRNIGINIETTTAIGFNTNGNCYKKTIGNTVYEYLVLPSTTTTLPAGDVITFVINEFAYKANITNIVINKPVSFTHQQSKLSSYGLTNALIDKTSSRFGVISLRPETATGQGTLNLNGIIICYSYDIP